MSIFRPGALARRAHPPITMALDRLLATTPEMPASQAEAVRLILRLLAACVFMRPTQRTSIAGYLRAPDLMATLVTAFGVARTGPDRRLNAAVTAVMESQFWTEATVMPVAAFDEMVARSEAVDGISQQAAASVRIAFAPPVRWKGPTVAPLVPCYRGWVKTPPFCESSLTTAVALSGADPGAMPPFWRLVAAFGALDEKTPAVTQMETIARWIAACAQPILPGALAQGRLPFANYLSLLMQEVALTGRGRMGWSVSANHLHTVGDLARLRYCGVQDFMLDDAVWALAYLRAWNLDARNAGDVRAAGGFLLSALIETFANHDYATPTSWHLPSGILRIGPALEAAEDPGPEDTTPARPTETLETPVETTPDPGATDAPAPVTTPPGANNNSIGLSGETSANTMRKSFLLVRDGETSDATLYRLAVVAVARALEKNPHIQFDRNKLEQLRVWCTQWIFVAAVAETKALVDTLNLQSVLGPLSEIV